VKKISSRLTTLSSTASYQGNGTRLASTSELKVRQASKGARWPRKRSSAASSTALGSQTTTEFSGVTAQKKVSLTLAK
jgi:hypothetical protein